GMFERYVGDFIEVSQRHYFDFWRALARGFDAVLRMRRSELINGLEALRMCYEELQPLAFGRATFAAELARGFGMTDPVDDALQVVDSGLYVAERYDERWYVPELLHVRGQLLLVDGPTRDPCSAESCLRQSLGLSREQGAAFWELRTATSLTQLWRDQGREV